MAQILNSQNSVSISKYCGKLFLSIELNICIPFNPALPAQPRYSTGVHRYVHQRTSTRMFLAAIFVVAKNWKQPKCLQTVEWINKDSSFHTQPPWALNPSPSQCEGVSIDVSGRV